MRYLCAYAFGIVIYAFVFAPTQAQDPLHRQVIIPANTAGLVQIEQLGAEVGSPVRDLQFSTDSTQLITAYADGTVRLWNVTAQTAEVYGQYGRINNANFDAAMEHFLCACVTATFSRGIQLIDLTSRETLFESRADDVFEIAVNTAGDRLVTITGDVSKMRDHQLTVWNMTNNRQLFSVYIRGSISDVLFSPDDAFIAVGEQSHILLFDAETGAQISEFEPVYPISDLGGLIMRPVSLAFNDEGTLLSTVSPEGFIFLWNMEDNTDMRGQLSGYNEIEPDITGTWYPHRLEQGVAFNPTGEIIAAAGGDVLRLWDVSTGKPLITINRAANIVEFSPDGRFLAAAVQGGISIWAVED